MRKINKLFTTALVVVASLTSVSANALMREYVSLDTIPLEELKTYKLADNASIEERYMYALSLSQEGLLSKNNTMWVDGQNRLKHLATEEEYPMAMLTIADHLRNKYKRECTNRKCRQTPRQDVIEWYEMANEHDDTGEVAFELASYWASMGVKTGREESLRWSKIGRRKSDGFFSRLFN